MAILEHDPKPKFKKLCLSVGEKRDFFGAGTYWYLLAPFSVRAILRGFKTLSLKLGDSVPLTY